MLSVLPKLKQMFAPPNPLKGARPSIVLAAAAAGRRPGSSVGWPSSQRRRSAVAPLARGKGVCGGCRSGCSGGENFFLATADCPCWQTAVIPTASQLQGSAVAAGGHRPGGKRWLSPRLQQRVDVVPASGQMYPRRPVRKPFSFDAPVVLFFGSFYHYLIPSSGPDQLFSIGVVC